MKHSPRLILYLAIKNYLSEEQFETFKQELGKKKIIGDLIFLKTLQKHFDIELFRSRPFIWQDIWIYNYLMYEMKGNKFPRRGLIVKYDNEIIKTQENTLNEAKKILESLE